MNDANVKAKDLTSVAYTRGPGLLGALLVGSSFAKSMAMALGIPCTPVNHIEGHVYSHFINKFEPELPFICLIASGGHTQLILMEESHSLRIIGETLDDAAGEAFDKGAKLLGLDYPGGALIDKYAALGDSKRYLFSKSVVPNLDYSFSGIKTSLLYFLKKEVDKNPVFINENLCDLCAGYQKSIIDMLMEKLTMAAEKYNVCNIGIGGGVSANTGLRARLKVMATQLGWSVFLPDIQYCTDNAAMIALVGYYRFMAGKFGDINDAPLPRMKIENHQS